MTREERLKTCIHSIHLSGFPSSTGGVYSGTCTGSKNGTDCSKCIYYFGVHTPTHSPINGLDQEVSMIKDEKIRMFVSGVLKTVPSYFWTAPASSTGKHHPIDARAEGGLVRHTKKAVFFSAMFVRVFSLEAHYDLVYAALILHDGRKFGDSLEDYGTYKNHGYDMVQHNLELMKTGQLQPWDANKHDQEFVDKINVIHNAILSHAGKWHGDQERLPQTQLDQVVHLSDMVSANKGIVNGWNELGELVYVG